MRAVYLEDIESKEFLIVGDKCHHLVSVVRLKLGEKILLLDGKGGSLQVEVAELSKKCIRLKTTEVKSFKESSGIQVAIGIPKKDALDLCLKQVVEMGVEKVFLIQTEYSQKIHLSQDRLNRVLVSALEQSNNPWLPQIEVLSEINELKVKNLENILYFSSQYKKSSLLPKLPKSTLLLIGPEGGLSSNEEDFLNSMNANLVHFEGGIMRTPTALSFGVGYLCGKLE